MIIHIAQSHILSVSEKAIISLQKCQTRCQEQKLIDLIWQSTWKTKLLRTSSEWHFQTPSHRISHHIHIVRTSCRQLSARYGIFWILVQVVYWLCDLKFLYQMVNLAILGIIVKGKLPTKFWLHSFEWFCLQVRNDTKCISLSYTRHCDQALIVVRVFYFLIWNKKEHNIIISSVISSHMSSMYIEMPYISSHMGPMYIEMPYISSHMGLMYIETSYIRWPILEVTWVLCS